MFSFLKNLVIFGLFIAALKWLKKSKEAKNQDQTKPAAQT